MARNGTGKGGGLSPRDAQLAGLVAGGSTYAEAAGQLKISERTVKRAMSRPEVRAEVDAVRGRTLEAGLGLLSAAEGESHELHSRVVPRRGRWIVGKPQDERSDSWG